jgi:hypothetical protein
VDGGTQPAHGDRGVHAMPHHVAHHQGDPCARQRDHVEPVAADVLPRGQIAVGDVEGVLRGQTAGEQAALERHRHVVLPGVPPGVVDGDGGAGAQFLGKSQVVVPEGLGVPRTPEVRHPQERAPGGQRGGDEGVDPVGEHLFGSLHVLHLPLDGLVQIRFDDRPAGAEAPQPGPGGGELDWRARGEERVPQPDAGGGGATEHLLRSDGLLPAQDGLREVDSDVVGELRHRHFGQFLSRSRHVEGGTDPHGRVVQQLETSARLLGPAGERLELGGVAERHDVARRPAVLVDVPLVDGEHPASRQMHLVRGLPVRGQQFGGLRSQPQFSHVASFGIRWETEQPLRLVVGQEDPPTPVDDEDPFPGGVQDSVVMIEHTCDLGRSEPVGLARQPSADQGGPARRESHRAGGATGN